MANDKADVLKSKLDLDAIAPADPARGVALVWTPAVLRGLLPAGAWELLGDTTLPVGPGEVMRKWIWGRGAARLTVTVFVSSDGPRVPRERLVKLATENMRPDVPYVRGPHDLGDVSTIFSVPPAFAHLIWAYTNVCVAIKAQDAPGVDVTRLARALQAHLAEHVAPRLDPWMPSIERATTSKHEVQVGEPLTIQVRMRQADPSHELLVAIKERDPKLRIEEGPGLTTTVSVDVPGPRRLTMMVADGSTLLSAWAAVVFEVTPPGDDR